MVMEEREASFRQALADQAYNVCLLDEHRRAGELLVSDITVNMEVDM